MASWAKRNLLACGAMLLMATASASLHADTEVIDPELDRRDINYRRIDNEIVEISPYIGVLAIEDFDTSFLWGARLGVYLNEYLFVEGSYGAAQGDSTSYEELIGSPLFLDDERDYTFWDVTLGINLFPGEAWLFGRAFSSNFYLVAGAGSTEFGDDDWTTITAGAGYRLFLTDWMALRIDVRDHIFNRDLFGEDDQTHNIELSSSLSFFF